jgi:hypothetical protein
MFTWIRYKKNLGKTSNKKNNAVLEGESAGKMLSSNLEVNMETLKETFQNCSDVVFRQFTIDDGTKALPMGWL